MQLRPSVAEYAFDPARFDGLVAALEAGTLDPSTARLPRAPTPLAPEPVDLRTPSIEQRQALERRGTEALRAGRIAAVVLNGGMATRFGGGAKGAVPIVAGRDAVTFLAVKLAQVRRQAQILETSIPVALMHSFATRAPSEGHLQAIDWSNLAPGDRGSFVQSIMPRVRADGAPLQSLAEAADLPDTTVYAAPGHGDTLRRLRESGTIEALRRRGVEHVLVSNVDNLGADLDPMVVGAHLEAVDAGNDVTVEAVRRAAGDAGGCVAVLPPGVHAAGQPAIIEGFRLPAGTDLADYPHFNTNTLWLRLDAIDRDFDLTWFAVRKTIAWPTGELDIVQFEQLIGQVTEFVPSAFVEVDRDRRFLPIKTRDELHEHEPRLAAFAREAGL